MNYDPAKHHRHSIRLKGFDYTTSGAYFITICTHHRECLFGEIVNGTMQLNPLGQIVQRHWLKLPNHHRHLSLDEFVIMPDHIHGILVLHDGDVGAAVGAGLGNTFVVNSDTVVSKPAPTEPDPTRVPMVVNSDTVVSKPAPTEPDPTEPPMVVNSDTVVSKPAPTEPDPTRVTTKRHGVPEIIRGFKTFSARRINQTRRTPGIPVWQRTFHDRIIRDDEAMQRIRHYIQNNPSSWQRGKRSD